MHASICTSVTCISTRVHACMALSTCISVQEQMKQRLDRELDGKAEAIAAAQIEEEGVRLWARCSVESATA